MIGISSTIYSVLALAVEGYRKLTPRVVVERIDEIKRVTHSTKTLEVRPEFTCASLSNATPPFRHLDSWMDSGLELAFSVGPQET